MVFQVPIGPETSLFFNFLGSICRFTLEGRLDGTPALSENTGRLYRTAEVQQ